MKFFNKLFKQQPKKPTYIPPKGFIDFKTGKRVEINPITNEEYFV